MATFKHADAIEVRIWNRTVGAVVSDPDTGTYAFQYAPAWARRGIELAPLYMPVSDAKRVFVFPSLSRETYQGLPGLLADALPDDFGNAAIDAYMANRGLDRNAVTTLDRLAYMGKRGMGALEFRPARGPTRDYATMLDVAELVRAARDLVHGELSDEALTHDALTHIIQVGSSAGGARAKAVIAYNPKTHEMRSGQFDVPAPYEHWLIKFDGMDKKNKEPFKDFGPPLTFGSIEYAYYRMATAAGIEMSECRLLPENGRRHFMTKRFDRDGNRKHHLQTLCGMAHIDFKRRAANSYGQLFQVIDELGLGVDAKRQAFLRMTFNVAARNCDDHSKNHSFLLKEAGSWELAPAYDISFAFNPKGEWTYQHLMSVNDKWLDIKRADLMAVADTFGVPGAADLIANVEAVVSEWEAFAKEVDIPSESAAEIRKVLPAL